MIGSLIYSSNGLGNSFDWLYLILFSPVFIAGLIYFLPQEKISLYKRVAQIGALVIDVFMTIMLIAFKAGIGGYQMVEKFNWISLYGVTLKLGVDGISLFLVLLVGLIFTILFFIKETENVTKSYFVWMFLLEATCLGSFLSLDLLAFFIFFEFSLVPAYFIIVRFGGQKREFGAMYFFLYTLLGSAFFFVGLLVLEAIHYNQTQIFSFSILSLEKTHLSLSTQILLLLAFSAAFFVKVPVFPFHTWSPVAYKEAPIGGSIALASVMAKLGAYGIIRFDLTLFPEASKKLAPLFLTFGVLSMLYGAILACVQKDLKKLVAYSSLSHLGFVVLGAFALTQEGINGGVYQMVSHGIITAGMFIVIGLIISRLKTTDISSFSGLQRKAPVLAGFMMVFILAGLGLPGLGGFVGEFLVLLGTFISHRWWAIAGILTIVISATYLLWMYQRAFQGKLSAKVEKIKDLNFKERAVLIPLALVILFLGIYPNFVISRVSPSVNLLLKNKASQVEYKSATVSPQASALINKHSKNEGIRK